jgi:hypothetical protein
VAGIVAVRRPWRRPRPKFLRRRKLRRVRARGKARRGGDGGRGARLWSARCGEMTAVLELGPAVHGGLGRAMRKRAPESEEGV